MPLLGSLSWRIGRAVLALTILLAAASAQIQRSAAEKMADDIVFVGMFQSYLDLEDTRTPCQRLRDFFDPSGRGADGLTERPAVCDKVVDVIAGTAEPATKASNRGIRAARIVTDSRGRILFAEPSTRAVHIFDFVKKKYSRIEGVKDNRLLAPYALAVDRDDNIFVTDQKLGVIAVFDRDGDFRKYIGHFGGQETLFEQPNSIAIDRASGHIYVADTSRQFVIVLDREGKLVCSIGKRGGGDGPGEFRLPSDVALHGQELFVFDKGNERIQVFDLQGRYKREISTARMGADALKGMAIDRRGLIYTINDLGVIQRFDPQGQGWYRFGHYGGGAGEFRNPRGIYIDSADRLYVSDTGNQRVQILQIKSVTATRVSAAARR